MKISILKIASDFRGDHSSDVKLAYELKPNETVDNLVKRILTPLYDYETSSYTKINYVDHIELRLINED